MFFYPLFLLMIDSLIRNSDKPACTNCIHYQPYTHEYTSTLSKCTKFGGKDIHTGIILYDYADSVRRDETKCGTKGIYFQRDTNVCFKKILHSIQSNLWFILCIVVFNIKN